MSKTTKVTGCNDCPLNNVIDNYPFFSNLICNHPDAPEKNQISEYEEQDKPEWCPLQKSPLTIEID